MRSSNAWIAGSVNQSQRVITKCVDHARNPFRSACDGLNSELVEGWFIICAGLRPTKLHVLHYLVARQRTQLATHGYPLLDLPEAIRIQNAPQLGLTSQNDLQ